MLVRGKNAVISFQNTLPVSRDFQFTELRERFIWKKIIHNAYCRGNSSYSIHQLNYIHSVKTSRLIKLLFQSLHCLKPKMPVVHIPTHRAYFTSSLTASWKAHCLQGGWVWQGDSELPTDTTDAVPARLTGTTKSDSEAAFHTGRTCLYNGGRAC